MSTLFSTITSYTSGLAFISAGETAEQYIRVLYELEDHCEFGGKRDKQLRDRLVVGKFARQRKLKARPCLVQHARGYGSKHGAVTEWISHGQTIGLPESAPRSKQPPRDTQNGGLQEMQ